jgi:uncharacterized membrane protein YedE/YeeE
MSSRLAACASFAAGAIFAVGLAISGMAKPAKIIGFLDVAGAWDASLMFVMVGAIGVHAIALRLVLRRGAPLFDERFHLPTRKDLDARLVGGAAIFGIGWGLGGYCPGPAIVAASSGALAAIVFMIGMTGGIFAENAIARRGGSS